MPSYRGSRGRIRPIKSVLIKEEAPLVMPIKNKPNKWRKIALWFVLFIILLELFLVSYYALK